MNIFERTILHEDDDEFENNSQLNLQKKQALDKKQKEVLDDIQTTHTEQNVGSIESYIKRNMPFVAEDEKIFQQVKTALADVKSEGDKVALLKKIDDVIANTSGSGEITWKDIVTTLGLAGLTHGMSLVYSFGKWAWGKSEKQQDFLDRMVAMRTAVAKYPVSTNTVSNSETAYDRT